jgi:hypothetical protein
LITSWSVAVPVVRVTVEAAVVEEPLFCAPQLP